MTITEHRPMTMDGPILLDITEDGGIFRPGADDVVDELDDALDGRDSGRLSETRFLSVLKTIVERHPNFIDGHVHLGYALMEQGKPKLALDACRRGLRLGESAIPAGFTGVIPWGFLENRPFLRAAHGAVLCHLRLGRRREALASMEKMLAWNPNDNHGMRFLIGSEYLRAGMRQEAFRILRNEAHDYPPYHYELGLLHLMGGDKVAAATSLRRGFMANAYIAEMLCGTPDPMPLAIWHESNFAEPETAHAYLDHYGEFWWNIGEAIPFLRWLHMHPKVLAERAAVFECKEALLWERDFNRRGALIEREKAALSGIDDRLSREIVVERADRHGQPVAPWLYPQTLSRFDA